MQNGDPQERQARFSRAAQFEIVGNLEADNVDIRLIEPVEKDKSIGAGSRQFHRHMSWRAEKGTDLDCNRDGHLALHCPDDIEITLLDIAARHPDVGW